MQDATFEDRSGSWVAIQIAGHAWTLDFIFIIYLIVAALVSLLAESVVGWKLPFGIIGAIIAALIGIWLMTQVIIITGIGDINVFGVSLFRTLVGAIVLVVLWHALMYRLWYRRHRRR
ncbi:MAG TPA: hypothetical protein VHV10_20750 [Ktedonobacteraceae bacterium]|nr:hypothetical protein [Ktedonobacteraceae bacterium]